MQTEEILKLERKVLSEVLTRQFCPDDDWKGKEKRHNQRWPFPGTVEVSPNSGENQLWLGTLRNVSETGLGMCCEEYLKPESVIDLAFHMPEASFYGKGVIRYCKEVRDRYMVGVEFLFD